MTECLYLGIVPQDNGCHVACYTMNAVATAFVADILRTMRKRKQATP